MKTMPALLIFGLAALGTAGSAEAHHRHWHHWHHRWHHAFVDHRTFPVKVDVLERNALGDRIVSGKIGFHRSDFSGMVPDSEGPAFILVGRASRSGFDGADGLPGTNPK